MNSNQLLRTKEILSKRIQKEINHHKIHCFFDSKTTLPSDSFQPKDFQKLISFYTQKLLKSKSKEELSEYYHLRGCVYFDNFQYEPALFDFQHAENIETNNPVLYYDLACAYKVLSEFERCELKVLKSLELFPDFLLSLLLLANLLKKKNNFTEYKNLSNRCIELEPDNILGYLSIMKLERAKDLNSFVPILSKNYYNEILRILVDVKPVDHQYSLCEAINRLITFHGYHNDKKVMNYIETCLEMCPGFLNNSHCRTQHQLLYKGLY
jgi:tetratricopeptide (TPR) repeat protein